MDARSIALVDVPCLVSRSGYTGEDGFEISIEAERAEALCEALLRGGSVEMAGLGARDTLRLEAGLCLYGADLTPQTSPVEAALEWTIAAARRAGGARAGGFPGADVILRQLADGGFGVSLDAPVAMGCVPIDAAAPGTAVFAEVRGRRLPVAVAALPFVAAHYKRH
jgi:aminomethyltransferase